MSDSKSAPLAVSDTDSPEYRPVSSLAVGALILGLIFSIILLGIIFFSVVSNRPTYVSGFLVIPLLGMLLAFFARLRIQQAEGVLSGSSVAAFAWWLCVLTGGGYGAYIFATGSAIKKQSDNFAVREYFEKLREKKVDEAFVRTLAGGRQGNFVPEASDFSARLENEYAQELQGFRTRESVNFFQRHGDLIKINLHGVRSWDYEKEGYTLINVYRFTSPEGIHETTVALTSSQVKDDPRRLWQIQEVGEENQPSFRMIQPTTYFRLAFEFINEARAFRQAWMESIAMGRRVQAIGMQKTVKERQEIESTYFAKLVALGGFAWDQIPKAPSDVVVGKSLFRLTDNQLPSEKDIETFGKIWGTGRFIPGEQNRGNPQGYPRLKFTDSGELMAGWPVSFPLPGVSESTPGYGVLWFTMKNEEIVSKIKEAYEAGKANPNQKDQSDYVIRGRTKIADWQLAFIETNLKPLPAPPMEQRPN
jgi:hypothetical protein